MELEENKIYRRRKWEEPWAFAKCPEGFYAYIDIETKQFLHNRDRRGLSRVGRSVINADDIECIGTLIPVKKKRKVEWL